MSKKIKKERITLKEAIENIPHDWAYCLDSRKCPYWRLRKCHSKGQMITKAKKDQIIGIPVWYSRNHELEYCMFLRKYLSIQDGCKDCGINEDFTEEMLNEELKSLNEYYAENSPEKLPATKEEILEFNGYDKPFRARIKNREYADFYKEMFPEESDLIDKIVEEDNLTYWYKEKKENVD